MTPLASPIERDLRGQARAYEHKVRLGLPVFQYFSISVFSMPLRLAFADLRSSVIDKFLVGAARRDLALIQNWVAASRSYNTTLHHA